MNRTLWAMQFTGEGNFFEGIWDAFGGTDLFGEISFLNQRWMKHLVLRTFGTQTGPFAAPWANFVQGVFHLFHFYTRRSVLITPGEISLHPISWEENWVPDFHSSSLHIANFSLQFTSMSRIRTLRLIRRVRRRRRQQCGDSWRRSTSFTISWGGGWWHKRGECRDT